MGLLSALKLLRKPPVPPVAPVKTLAVVEKQSFVKTAALSVGGGIVKTGAVVGGIGLVGAGAQQFKNSLFDGLANLGGGGLGNIGGSLGEALGATTDNLFNGVVIIGGIVVLGVIYKVLKK